MATSLQKQLAVIAANSTHQLDLKAQKQRHGKSLLFDPRDAAGQSFDTIYQLCYEGFEELCMLDTRFTPFAHNLFSEQSKDEDRTQMTAKQNEELDKILHAFLGLVCGRLLLKPAMQAVEWLVRRFRVQEYDTECLLLTFLPYHASHVFPTLMSILPEELPSTFKFLHPYVASLQSPPRHAVLAASINNHAFFSALSQYILRTARVKHHSANILGFWASITAQAVNGMIDSTRSGRDAVRKQREEDLLLRVLPVLQAAMDIKEVDELYIGSCVIMAILASRASLQDKVLDAMMEAVADGSTESTMTDAVHCLALLAEQKQQISQSPKVTKLLLKSPDTINKVMELSQVQRMTKLALSTIVGILDRLSRLPTMNDFTAMTSILSVELPTSNQIAVISEPLLLTAQQLRQGGASMDVAKAISRLLNDISDHEGTQEMFLQASRKTGVSLPSVGLEIATIPADTAPEHPAEPMEVDGAQEETSKDEFNAVLQNLPQVENTSFWALTNEDVFRQYLHAFEEALPSPENLDRLLCPIYLCKSCSRDCPTFLTFAARVWCSGTVQVARLRAITLATEVIRDQDGVDFQILLPYTLTALADPSQRVRRAAAELCAAIEKSYGSVPNATHVWASKAAYGPSTSRFRAETSDDAHKFLKYAVLPVLEDCLLDHSNILRLLANALDTDNVKQLKKGIRQSMCSTLASHALLTPVLRARWVTLQSLSAVGKIASDARAKYLIPLAKGWAQLDEAGAKATFAHEGLDLDSMDSSLVNVLSHRTQEEVSVLQDLASGGLTKRHSLLELSRDRIRRLWPLMSGDVQLAIADSLLDRVLANAESELAMMVQTNALDILRTVMLPSNILVHLVDSLPRAGDLQDQPSASKKRRTSVSQSDALSRPVDQDRLQAAVRRITVILELVESSKPENHPQLLKGLFHFLSELRLYKTLTGSELVYLHGILLGCLNSVVSGAQKTATTDADRSVIRTDLIVECVRTTSSTQIHNTALLLMSSLASWAPELVLHSVMPLFTFMSSTLLRQHDDFSAHVADQTVAKIVPPLAASLKKKGKDLVAGAAELLASFTAAFEHIPLHRRSALFEHLIETLGSDETLFAVVAMLVERYGYEGAVPGFVADLANHFSTATALKASTQYLDLVFDALKSKRKLADVLLGFGDKDTKGQEDSVDDLLEGLAGLLEDSTLRARLAGKPVDDADSDRLRSSYSLILEKTMQLNRELASNEILKESSEQLLSAVLGLMPTGDFIESSAQLMQTGSHETRQQVFRSLEARVVQARRGDKDAQAVFVDVLPNCAFFIARSQPAATRHAAISCVDQICEKFGKTNTEAVLTVAQAVAGDAALGSEDVSLRIISILCLASMVEVLDEGAVAVLPAVLKKTLAFMREVLEAESSGEQLLAAGFSLLGSVLDHLPWVLSSEYLDEALRLAAMTVTADESHLSQVFARQVSTKVGAAEVCAAIERVWEDVLSVDATATKRLVDILHGVIAHHNKATVTKTASTVFDILLRGFDLRRQLIQSEVAGIEGDNEELVTAVDRLALSTTLKLNDATFRPFFVRLVEWSTSLPKKDSVGRKMRMTSLLSFTLLLFEQLKSIVTSYASFVLDTAVSVLKRDTTNDALSRTLLDRCLQTLCSSFQNDQDDFWQAPAHFDAVAEPLLDQLVKARTLPATAHVIPTITELAAASSSPEHLKAINNRLMQLMKHSEAEVRLAAVQCERAVTDKLTFDWLALLPEMLPAISEAQEDDSEEVEREVLRWVRQIEEVSGESLEGMLA